MLKASQFSVFWAMLFGIAELLQKSRAKAEN
jgi:hypothetical protein